MTFCMGPQIEKIWGGFTNLFPKDYQYTLKMHFRATDKMLFVCLHV